MTTGDLSDVVDHGFRIGMSQIREEILGLAEFLREERVDSFLEIGTKWGGTFYVLHQISDIGGLKISLDMVGGPYGGWVLNQHPYLGDVVYERNMFLRKLSNDVRILMGDSHTMAMRIKLERILGKEKLDLLFIDGDHTYDGVGMDYTMYKKFVKKDGLIVFHDINDTQHHRNIGVQVGKFWNELKGEKIEFNTHTHWAGLGVLRV
jgi:hypothetical protein